VTEKIERPQPEIEVPEKLEIEARVPEISVLERARAKRETRHIPEVEEDVDVRALYKNLPKLVNEVKPMLISAKKLGIDITESRKLISDAIAAGKRRDIRRAVSLVKQSKTDLEDAFTEQIAESIESFREEVREAKELGAHYTVNPEEVPLEEYVSEISSEGIDKSVDCSAAQNGINALLDLTRKHGIVAQIGETGETPISINPSEQLIRKKLTYIGSWYFALGEWEEIADFIVHRIGNKESESIISHRYPLEEKEVDEGFRLFDQHETLKVVFTP